MTDALEPAEAKEESAIQETAVRAVLEETEKEAVMECFDPRKFSWLLDAATHADTQVNQRYGYFPYCRSKDEGLKEYSGEWKARNELRNEFTVPTRWGKMPLKASCS